MASDKIFYKHFIHKSPIIICVL